MNADTKETENWQKQILDEYYQGFRSKSTASGVLGSSAYG